MKRNISVFILLILLASSFKYRTKARESSQPLLPERLKSIVPAKAAEDHSFEDAVAQMQEANLAMLNGNPEPYKSMWVKNEEVTYFGSTKEMELKGWKAIEASLDAASARTQSRGNSYTFETVASDKGDQQGYLLQKEHYRLANGQTKDFQVTIVFRKENDAWKIVHRQADSIEPVRQSDKSAK